jgi:hypothetical protein
LSGERANILFENSVSRHDLTDIYATWHTLTILSDNIVKCHRQKRKTQLN